MLLEHGSTNVNYRRITNQGASKSAMPAGMLRARLDNNLRLSVLGKTPNSLNRCTLSSDYCLNMQSIYRGSLSHAAALYGNVKLVRMLFEHGANVGAEDDEGVTAFQLRLGWTWNTVVRTWCRQGNVTFRFLLVVVPVYIGKRISPELWQCGILEMAF